MKNKGGDPFILDAGDIFFSSDIVTGIKKDQSILRAQTLVDGYNIIGCEVLNIGARDFAEGRDFLRELEQTASFPFISANIIDKNSEEHLFDSYKIISKSNLQIGVLGLATRLPEHVDDLALLDPIEQGRKVLAELEKKSDYQIVLFNGTFKEAEAAKDSLLSADFIFLSGDTRLPSRKSKEKSTGPIIYRLGRQARSLGVINLEIDDTNLALVNISSLKSRESFITRQLDRMKKKDPSKKIEEIYKDNVRVLERIHKIKDELKTVKQQIDQAPNTVEFNFVSMSKKIENDTQLLTIVNETLDECKRIAKASKVPLTSLRSPDKITSQ